MKKFSLMFHIARKYLFARKSYAIINIVSVISIIGVAVGTMALFVVLSVFNGFEDLILSLFNHFHADIKIESVEGKTINLDEFPVYQFKSMENIQTMTYVIEDLALARYDERQHLVYVKAVSEDYLQSASLDSMIVRGDAVLKYQDVNYAILGAGVDYILGINPGDFTKAVSLYVPKRTAKASVALSHAFISEQVYPASVFSVQTEYDETYIIVPFETGQRLYDYENEVTSIEIMLKKGVSLKMAKREIADILGSKYVVKDRFQQQEFIYKILRSEKLAIFLILSFILIIATFNVIGTLSMIILEKQKDIAVMSAMGATMKFIRRLFIVEGMLVISIGTVLGIIAGAILCWLQQTYGLLSLGGGEADFVIQAYPVKMKLSDLLIILSTLALIGFLSSYVPARRINTAFASMNRQDKKAGL
jgi:lipoprotein-releasing system permease protein